MQNQLVTIVHVILIVILAVIGLFLFIDMQRVNEQHPTVEFVTEKDVVVQGWSECSGGAHHAVGSLARGICGIAHGFSERRL